MSNPGVKIVVKADGTLLVEGIDFVDASCEKHLGDVLQALNIDPDKEELKEEFYATTSQDQNQQLSS